VSHDFAATVAPTLFADTQISFNVNSFRQARMAALERIGHYITKLTFNMPHTSETFLPPLLDPITGQEQHFIYEPQVNVSRPSSSSSSSRSSSPKYGSCAMNDLLVRQYPPLFHAATNISSFIRALAAMPSLRHLHIACPDQPEPHRYRRSVVDYALISLRIAVSQANPANLRTLTLSPIHPLALLHLRPTFSIGATPTSARPWHRIAHLTISIASFPFTPRDPTDHLKILHTYLSTFGALESLHFTWLGLTKGPSPLSLDLEPCTSRPTSLDSSVACPLTSTRPSCRPLKFRHLTSMRLENAILDARQAAAFVMAHRKVLHEFAFEHCELRSGTWDDALAPLTTISGSEDWKRKQKLAEQEKEKGIEVMDVPIVLSQGLGPAERETVREMLWRDERGRSSRGLRALRKVGLRTKEMFGLGAAGACAAGPMAGVDHVRRLLRGSVMAWH
jgi:hypothetical protein